MSPLRLLRCAVAAVAVDRHARARAEPRAPTPANPWFMAARVPGSLRGGALGATANGKLYVFAGLAPGLEAAALVFEYDPASNQWAQEEADEACDAITSPSRASTTRSTPSAVLCCRNRGRQPGTRSTMPGNTIRRPTSGRSSRRCRPSAALRAAAVVGGKLYVTGGANSLTGVTENGIHPTRPHNVMSTVEEYDPATNSWRARRSLLVAAQSSRDRGRRRQDLCDRRPCRLRLHLRHQQQCRSGRVYDPAADLWTARARMPTARSAMGSGVYKDHTSSPPAAKARISASSPPSRRSKPSIRRVNRWLVLPSMAQPAPRPRRRRRRQSLLCREWRCAIRGQSARAFRASASTRRWRSIS